MPVSQIIDYFNDQMRVAPMRFLPEDAIRSRYGAVEGYFGPLRLRSVFQTLVAIASGGRLVVGHQAYLRAIGANYAALPAPEVFASAREAAAIVYLDRLCRTVHMLNFLRQANEDSCLFLHVHARHILSVLHEHGEYFEGLLHRCGLIPERIVIQSDPPSTGDADERRRTQAALRNYRRRGYRLAMNATAGVPRENILEDVLELQPDYVRLDRVCLAIGESQAAVARAMTLIALLHESGAKVIVHRLATTEQVRIATDYGVDVAAGSHFGRPSPDLSGGISIPVDSSRPFGNRTGTGPVRADEVFLRYA